MNQSHAQHSRLDDRTALHRFAVTGDPVAFEVLTNRHQSMVLSTCVRILRSPADAEDAAQETFLKLARNASETIERHHVLTLPGERRVINFDICRIRLPSASAQSV
jgi:Fe2+ or Zn2+ uptake regulation protein